MYLFHLDKSRVRCVNTAARPGVYGTVWLYCNFCGFFNSKYCEILKLINRSGKKKNCSIFMLELKGEQFSHFFHKMWIILLFIPIVSDLHKDLLNLRMKIEDELIHIMN